MVRLGAGRPRGVRRGDPSPRGGRRARAARQDDGGGARNAARQGDRGQVPQGAIRRLGWPHARRTGISTRCSVAFTTGSRSPGSRASGSSSKAMAARRRMTPGSTWAPRPPALTVAANGNFGVELPPQTWNYDSFKGAKGVRGMMQSTSVHYLGAASSSASGGNGAY